MIHMMHVSYRDIDTSRIDLLAGSKHIERIETLLVHAPVLVRGRERVD